MVRIEFHALVSSEEDNAGTFIKCIIIAIVDGVPALVYEDDVARYPLSYG